MEKYFLCISRYDAKRHCEIIKSRSKGYNTLDELLKAAEPWMDSHLGTKFFIQKYRV